jgi:uncharacterized protein (UPF0332 family)
MKEFLQVAAALVEHPESNEAFYRSAISRQYYALFNMARERLGIDDESADVHRLVADQVRAKNKRAGDYLALMRRLRNHADYLRPNPDWRAAARLHQGMSESMAKTIQALK